MNIFNARILTCDPKQPEASWFRVEDGRFKEVGGGAAAPPSGEDLQGAFVLPGLWDTHIHLLLCARAATTIDLSNCLSRQQLLQEIADYPSPPGEWLEGHGWGEFRWADSRVPTCDELEEAGHGRPCWLTRMDLHGGLASRSALNLAGIDRHTPDPDGGQIDRDERGEPTGLLYDRAMLLVDAVLPSPNAERIAQGMGMVCSQLHRWGIVGVCDQRLKDFTEGGALAWDIYTSPRPPLRIHCNRAAHQLHQPGPAFGEGDAWLRGGHVKFFLDGSMGSRTARMKEPYGSNSSRGLWVTPPDELKAGFIEAHQMGYPVSVHAIGDEALEVVLDCFASIDRHPLDRIEHVQLLEAHNVRRLAELGLTASMQPVHLIDDQSQAERLLGARAVCYYRLAALAAAGTRLAFGSDAPVASADPWMGMQAAVERRKGAEPAWYPEHCIDFSTSLAAYTREAALSLGWSDNGRIESGCWADWIVVDRDPRTVEHLSDIRVLRTVIGDKTVYPIPG